MTEPVVTPDAPQDGESHSSNSPRLQLLIGIGALLVAAVLAVGAAQTSSEAGYGGVGPNFLPWVVSLALLACGVFLIRESRSGGYREMEEVEGEESPDWINFVWVSAGLLLNAGLIEHLGFIISCTLAYVLAVQGLRRAYGKPHDTWLVDVITGFLISAPVYWLFTKFLAINLPGLTNTGWI